jgi:hypothetical protein
MSPRRRTCFPQAEKTLAVAQRQAPASRLQFQIRSLKLAQTN